MKIKLLAIVASLLLPFQLATADIAADFKAKMSVANVLKKAMDGGMSVEDAVTKMVTLKPKMAAQIVDAAVKASPGDAGVIVAAVISIQCNNNDSAILKNQCKSAITTAAIDAGADPTLVTAATAAGSTRPITRVASTPAPGSGGGVVASPN